MDPQLRQAIVSGRRSFWISVVAFALLLVISFGLLWVIRDIQFDSALWQHQEQLRPRMVRNLLGEHQLVGMSRGEINEMLGKPRGRDSIRDGAYIYWAGEDGVIDDMWLKIECENNIVTATRYVPD